MAEVRIATFNLENFDETAVGEWPSLAGRIQLMRPKIVRLSADIVCFQEVNGQERPNEPRSLLALTDGAAERHQPGRRQLHLAVRRRLGRGLLHILDETDVAGPGGPQAHRPDP
jgi:hypothetical protein